MAKLLNADGKPFNVERDPPKLNSPDREVLRVLRIVETAYRTDTAELCATLLACFNAAWGLTHDPSLPEWKAEITIVSNLSRDADNKLVNRPERWIRLGDGYLEALSLLKQERDKECIKSTESQQ